KTCLPIPAQPAAEVTDKPLQLQVRQLVPGVNVQSNGYRSQAGKECETGQRPERHAVAADVQVKSADRVSRRRRWQKRGERDVFSAPGLFDAFQVDAQARLFSEGGFDGLGKSEDLGRFAVSTTFMSRHLQGGVLGGSFVRRYGLH